MTSSAGKWWKRAAAAIKDKRSVYLCLVQGGGQRVEIEAAVIRATTHDERSVDYKNAGRVFTWARTSPPCLALLMGALARRATRTRSWAVALKTLLLAHGVLLCSTAASKCLGRLPFDLSDFRDRSSASYGFTAFVRAYFQFLDHRSVLSSSISQFESSSKLLPAVTSYSHLDMLVRMQELLELLMQIRPYADGMEVGLILEAMDCVIIEIFEVYSNICSGIGSFLVDVLGPPSSSSSLSLTSAAASQTKTGVSTEEWKQLGMAGVRIIRRAAQQSEQLSSYFRLCRSLGVLNAAEIPPVETISEEDIIDLEALVRGDIPRIPPEGENCRKVGEEEERGMTLSNKQWETVVTDRWEVFEDEKAMPPVNSNENPFFCLEDEEDKRSSWPASVPKYPAAPFGFSGGNLIELI